MIFGFNTDIKHGDTVYHVQSEARQNDRLLQTQVFIRGRCVGKRASSYADRVAQPDFSDEQMHELLKEQHRLMIAAIREDRLDDVLRAEILPVASAAPGLSIEWMNAESSHGD